ncbi:hypothetical protein, partial [uncultured Halomonas sp.]|uniref:hypothetical protein n=1 Tax=uncultured Halomonas sp. TaxID=173971 RepID=UPI00260EEF07
MKIIPAAPDLSAPYVERYEFKTDVLRSEIGREQRQALRHQPRVIVEHQLLLSGADGTAWRRFLAEHTAATVWGRDWPRQAVVESQAGDVLTMSLTLDVLPGEYILAGDAALLVTHVNGREVTIAGAETITPGATAYALHRVLIDGRQTSQQIMQDVSRSRLTLIRRHRPGAMHYEVAGSMWRSRPVWLRQPNW